MSVWQADRNDASKLNQRRLANADCALTAPAQNKVMPQLEQHLQEQHLQVALGGRAGMSEYRLRIPGQHTIGHSARKTQATCCSEHDAQHMMATNLSETRAAINYIAPPVQAGNKHAETKHELGCGSAPRCILLGRHVYFPGIRAAPEGYFRSLLTHEEFAGLPMPNGDHDSQ